MFNRVAIINRGEAAMRLIHAVRELCAETGVRTETVAFYTDVDRTATFVREADLSYDLGAASSNPYLDLAVLERALRSTDADSAWVGWGFVAESPAFAELCETVGVTFIGPDPDAMRKLGDKIGSKLLAERLGVPVAPWSGGAVDDVSAALTAAEEVGYPLMLKAAAGGGGRGIRVITSAEEMIEAYERTRMEAERAFGSGVVFLERLVTGARHVEAQVIADGQGTAWALGVRDCTVQRRNQKIIEESASPVLTAAQVGELKDAAERVALAVDYRGAGTVEFLYQPGERRFSFLEVNTRLQVEHTVTEATTGMDLVKAQLHVATGGRLGGEPPTEVGYAIEARLNAEDPDRAFAPSPGRVVRLDLPAGPGIRVDTGLGEGEVIPAEYDSMIAKIVAQGRDRSEALGRLRRAVGETTVIIAGGATNKSFLLDLLHAPEVVGASADTSWIDRVRAEGGLVAQRGCSVALLAAAIEVYEEAEEVARQRLLSTANGGRPQVQFDTNRPVELDLRDVRYQVHVGRVTPQEFRLVMTAGNGVPHTADVDLERFDAQTGRITVNRAPFRLTTHTYGPTHLVEVDSVTHRVSHDAGGVVRAPAPALVVATPVEVGEEAEQGAPVLVLESMKMETVLRAPFYARVIERPVTVGSQVESGAAVLRLEPIGDGTDAGSKKDGAAGVDLPPAPIGVPPAELLAVRLHHLRGLMLGFDAESEDVSRMLEGYLTARRAAVEQGHGPLAEELELLDVFVDLVELSRSRPPSNDDSTAATAGQVHSARELFHTYLQSLDVERAGLPEAFQAILARVLRHYGVVELARSNELEAAVFRIFLAQRRASELATLVSTLLREWLRDPYPLGTLREPIGLALERLIYATQTRFPEVADLARGIVFAWFAQPLLRRNRAHVYANVRRHLRHLDAHPDAPDRAERIAEMVRSTEPLVRLLGQRLLRDHADNTILLEVLTRRYYGNKGLFGVSTSDAAGYAFVVAERAGSCVASVAVSFNALGRALCGLAALADGGGIDGLVDADIYLAWETQPEGSDEMAAELDEIVRAHPLPARVRRITVAVAGGDGAVMHQHFTFRPSDVGLIEDRLIRGLHPYIAERMRLERLREFDLTRLPSPDEDVYLFQCVALENPSDERLVAFAQVRDLTALREHDGRLVALPTTEGIVATCLESIRRAQSLRDPKKRFDTNRIVVYVWPPSDFTRAELEMIAQRVLPTTMGAGLEEIEFIARKRDHRTGELSKTGLRISFGADGSTELTVGEPPEEPIEPIDDYRQKVLRASSRGTVYPYELTEMLAGAGTFTEYDLDAGGALVPVHRPTGHNAAALVAGLVSTPTEPYPEGIARVVLLGDPTKSLGALSEPECARVIAALDLAERRELPLEWFALSAGARIAMESGTENMDWVAAALKRIVTFTQAGGELNIVVAGINVGAQPYWNAEATMLMHTKGILVMTPDSAMVLTGKQSLDFSGGVSAEDNVGIGGYERVMGPNGQAQYWASSLAEARDILMAHYEHTYVAPGELGPRRAATTDPHDRDISSYPHAVPGSEFDTVGEIFSMSTNPDRKKPFDIRTVMRGLADQDHAMLERWSDMADAGNAVVADVHLGGTPVCLLGIESRPIPRRGFPPTDGPDTYTAGTLFPQSSKKAARAINATSGNRPLVVLANLSGFDGSPESMRKLQLEYGAGIGRAITNFQGPIVFCVISRYHGGAFVVFSKALNPNMTVLAVEGSVASVIGGPAAAAVVFASEVTRRTTADKRVTNLEALLADTTGTDHAELSANLATTKAAVRTEKLTDVAAEFDQVHNIRRAVKVGSVDAVINAAKLRPQIIKAISPE